MRPRAHPRRLAARARAAPPGARGSARDRWCWRRVACACWAVGTSGADPPRRRASRKVGQVERHRGNGKAYRQHLGLRDGQGLLFSQQRLRVAKQHWKSETWLDRCCPARAHVFLSSVLCGPTGVPGPGARPPTSSP